MIGLSQEGLIALEPRLDQPPHLLLDAAITRTAVADLLPLEERLDPPGSFAVLAVAALPLPRLERVVLDPIEPAAHERVADLDLVVEERERQTGIERGDPERDPGQFHGERVDVHAVDAPLDDVPPAAGP